MWILGILSRLIKFARPARVYLKKPWMSEERQWILGLLQLEWEIEEELSWKQNIINFLWGHTQITKSVSICNCIAQLSLSCLFNSDGNWKLFLETMFQAFRRMIQVAGWIHFLDVSLNLKDFSFHILTNGGETIKVAVWLIEWKCHCNCWLIRNKLSSLTCSFTCYKKNIWGFLKFFSNRQM